MKSSFLVAALLFAACTFARARDVGDPYACFGAGRYEAMAKGRYCSSGSFSGVASFYGKESGPQTASGEPFDENALTCAHRSLPFGTRLRVFRADSNVSVIVRVNDRGPFVKGRVLDLSTAAARALNMTHAGVVQIIAEILE